MSVLSVTTNAIRICWRKNDVLLWSGIYDQVCSMQKRSVWRVNVCERGEHEALKLNRRKIEKWQPERTARHNKNTYKHTFRVEGIFNYDYWMEFLPHILSTQWRTNGEMYPTRVHLRFNSNKRQKWSIDQNRTYKNATHYSLGAGNTNTTRFFFHGNLGLFIGQTERTRANFYE